LAIEAPVLFARDCRFTKGRTWAYLRGKFPTGHLVFKNPRKRDAADNQASITTTGDFTLDSKQNMRQRAISGAPIQHLPVVIELREALGEKTRNADRSAQHRRPISQNSTEMVLKPPRPKPNAETNAESQRPDTNSSQTTRPPTQANAHTPKIRADSNYDADPSSTRHVDPRRRAQLQANARHQPHSTPTPTSAPVTRAKDF